MRATLALEDGRLFRGMSFGASDTTFGEVVFHTGMTGYQEVISDPSYRGQIVAMTAPLIGNYGVNPEDNESHRLHLSGFVVREYCDTPSNWRSSESLGALLAQHGIPGITGIDTRALTRHIRTAGALRGGIGVGVEDADLLEKVKGSPGLFGRDLVAEVRATAPYDWEEPLAPEWVVQSHAAPGPLHARVAVLDCGVKFGILRRLRQKVTDVKVFPAGTPAPEILEWAPDGVLLSNGPGDPTAVEGVVATVRDLMGNLPIFGICLGHQVLALALGATTYKLKFGHHGANHPVKNLLTGDIEITSQNHGFAVDEDSLLATGAEVTRRNLNDGTIEGFRHRELDIQALQYHPEACPGPNDAAGIFDDFARRVGRRAAIATGDA